jgi:hypothetical protein
MFVSRTIRLMHDAPRDRIPQDVLDVMTQEERDAFFDHGASFSRLAAGAAHLELKQYLKRIADQEVFWVALESTDEHPYRVFFHHTEVQARESFRIRLPRPSSLPVHLPRELEPIYRSLGGLGQEFGCLMCPEDIRPMAEVDVWLSEDNSIDPTDCYLFYEIGNGDLMAYGSTGDGVMYEHEAGILSPWDLDGFLSDYFARLFDDS